MDTIWGNPLMGQQWSAVALNEAKKTHPPSVILLTSQQLFPSFTAKLRDLSHGAHVTRTEPNEPRGLIWLSASGEKTNKTFSKKLKDGQTLFFRVFKK